MPPRRLDRYQSQLRGDDGDGQEEEDRDIKWKQFCPGDKLLSNAGLRITASSIFKA